MSARSGAMNRVSARGGAPRGVRQWARNLLLTVSPPGWISAAGSAASGAVYLTFDDGPHPEHTPAVLEVLRTRRARGTFFVLGSAAVRYPELVRRIVAEGHRLANHSYWHAPPDDTSAEALVGEARLTQNVLQRLCGARPELFRPPHGKLTALKLLRLWAARQRVVLWNVDPRDYAAATSDEVAAFFRERPLCAGDIVLLHDVTPHAAKVLPAVIDAAQRRGFRFEALPEGGGTP